MSWTINQHMIVDSVCPERAARQHAALLLTFERLGAELIPLPFVHGAYDSVFAKDSAVLAVRDGVTHALLATPLYAERKCEQRPRARELRRSGFIVHPAPEHTLEGGDVVVLPRAAGAFLGTGFRSSPLAASALEAFLDAPVTVLTLRDPLLYHLDTALAALEDGTLLVCEEAFTSASLDAIIDRAPADVVAVSREDAVHFALNVVEIGDAVVMGGPSAHLAGVLTARGREVVIPNLDEFHRAGGSAGCLVARVHDLDQARVAVSPTAAMRSTAA